MVFHLVNMLLWLHKKLKIKKIFVSTDCPTIKKIGKKYNAIHINRPKIACSYLIVLRKMFLNMHITKLKSICNVDIVVLLICK